MLKCLKEYTADYPRSRLVDLYVDQLPVITAGGFPAAMYPLTLPRAEYADLTASTTALVALHQKAVRLLGDDSAARMQALRANPSEFPREFLDEEYEHDHSADMARGDVIISADGPKFIELNVGAGFGGMVQFEVHRRIWSQVATESGQPQLIGTDPYASLARLISKSAATLGTAQSAAFINSGEDSGRPRAQVEAQLELLRDHGVTAKNVDFRSHLDEIKLGDSNPLAIFQYSERESLDEGWDLSGIRELTSLGLRGIPSQTARLLDSKKILAMLSEGLPWMSAEDVRLVQRVVPWTRIVRDAEVDWHGSRVAMYDLLVTHQNRFVLKGSAGYSAKEVNFGYEYDADEWDSRVRSAIETEYFVAQEVVESVELAVDIMHDDSGNSHEMLGKLVVNPFCVDGVTTGCRARIDLASKRVISLKGGASTACLLGDPTT
ncbi:hypothetical protein QQY66_18515 [Streptomyces sp. DG2A-72]|uniref:hypothetical protein n=1 Tax=Streptomyces sp. DG2A-72 TaxID=3051386 RepID=UPI00265BBBEB|nr:hypothetical protein [Streptomyces sp. DG2A-72]MDO0933578.1 hypothetical protein [Streptomyces sp. DG2A-72]